MGIGQLENNFEASIVASQSLKWNDIVLCELGNMERKIEPKMPAKQYYTDFLGVKEHISIDINGKWGSLQLDLDKPIPDEFKNKFDLVTNYGTGEHVNNQYSFFKNAHDLCKKDGIIIHALVPIGNWLNHCRYYYDENFVFNLANKCDYEILSLSRDLKYSDRPDTELIMVAYKKRNERKFIDEAEFSEIKIHDTGLVARTGDYTNKNNLIQPTSHYKYLFGLIIKLGSKFKRKIFEPLIKINQYLKKIQAILDNGIEITDPKQKLQQIIGEGASCRSTLSASERLFLYKEASSHLQEGQFLEVGSYLGASAIVLAEALKQKSGSLNKAKVYCIDTWQNDAMSEGKRSTYQDFTANTKAWSEIIVPISGNSKEVSLPHENIYDVVFIDGDHSYEGCRHDVDRFAPLVREGGCLIMDDHISYTGVTKVIGELLSTGEWYVGASHFNIIALYKDKQSLGKHKRNRRGNRVLHG